MAPFTPFASILTLLVTTLVACTPPASSDSPQPTTVMTEAELGRVLFSDVSLSRDGRQSCASCHDAGRGFIDSRVNNSSAAAGLAAAFSLGQDGVAMGDINVPSAAYLSFAPDFHFDKEEDVYKGGFFLNGRANTLLEQAQQPFLNPLEMQTTAEAVVAKVERRYSSAMLQLYGDGVFADTDTAFTAIAKAIAAFESTELFAPFDSKFDRVLRGEDTFSELEMQGKELFVAEEKGNCAACHPVGEKASSKAELLFTDFTYDNLGVPANSLARAHNGKLGHRDNGLFDNPKVSDVGLKGAFRVPSLRNVAVTAPYMHNGYFQTLGAVLKFYNDRDVPGAINPETKEPWKVAEVDETVNKEELGDLGLSEQEMVAVVAFLKTLTDQRYEHLQ